MRARRIASALIILLLVCLGWPAPATSQSQDQPPNGVIVEANPLGTVDAGLLNPLFCWKSACGQLNGFLFPTLLGVDPATATYAANAPNGLVEAWEIVEEAPVVIFHLRTDRTWSDGQPITAYDVAFSFYGYANPLSPGWYAAALRAAIPLDDGTIAFVYNDPIYATCSAPDHTQMAIIPAHVFDPGYADQLAASVANTWGGTIDPATELLPAIDGWLNRWAEAYPADHYRAVYYSDYGARPTVTAGVFEFAARQPTAYIRLATAHDALGYSYVDVPPDRTALDLFRTGVTNIIQNPPYFAWDDLKAAPDVRVAEYPGLTWTFLSFNLANPRAGLPAFDEDGVPLDQGVHPILGDVRVRRAIQLALDVETLIDVGVNGHGTPLAANQIPASWAFDPTLEPVAYDPIAAGRLLDEAGWHRVDGIGTRVCMGCSAGEENQRLTIRLAYDDTLAALANVIGRQLTEVGIQVIFEQGGTDALHRQTYDTYLGMRRESFPVNLDQAAEWFTPAGDVPGRTANPGSYHNPEVTALFEQARDLPGCDLAARAELYQQASRILQADQPVAWLFVTHDLIAARDTITGFDPYPHAPFWNITEWVVSNPATALGSQP